MPLLTTGAGVFLAAAAASGTTWNSSDKATDITLDGTLLIASNTTGNFNDSTVRAVQSISGTDKKYWEVVQTTAAATEDCGGALAGHNLATKLATSVNAFAYNKGGFLYIANTTASSAQQTSGGGDTICWALDFANAKIWVRKNGGNWNNDASADPSTNTNGFSLAALSGALYPAAMIWFQNDVYTAKFASSSWGFSAPSGFSQVG